VINNFAGMIGMTMLASMARGFMLQTANDRHSRARRAVKAMEEELSGVMTRCLVCGNDPPNIVQHLVDHDCLEISEYLLEHDAVSSLLPIERFIPYLFSSRSEAEIEAHSSLIYRKIEAEQIRVAKATGTEVLSKKKRKLRVEEERREVWRKELEEKERLEKEWAEEQGKWLEMRPWERQFADIRRRGLEERLYGPIRRKAESLGLILTNREVEQIRYNSEEPWVYDPHHWLSRFLPLLSVKIDEFSVRGLCITSILVFKGLGPIEYKVSSSGHRPLHVPFNQTEEYLAAMAHMADLVETGYLRDKDTGTYWLSKMELHYVFPREKQPFVAFGVAIHHNKERVVIAHVTRDAVPKQISLSITVGTTRRITRAIGSDYFERTRIVGQLR